MKTRKTTRIFSWLKRIGRLRDGLLVAATVLYILGYLVWSLNALVGRLGLLPLIDSQYFVAGIGPAVILSLAYLAFRNLRQFVDWLSLQIGPGAAGRKLVLSWVVFICFWLFMGGFFVSLIYWRRLGPTIVLLVLWLVFGFFYAASEKTTDRVQKWNALLLTFLFTFGLASVLVSFYIALHRNLPHELGGLRPRCAYVDITKSQISDETIRDLISSDAITSDRQILRSVKLSVYFSSSEFMLVKPHVQPQQAGGAASGVYEIQKKVINAVHWCS